MTKNADAKTLKLMLRLTKRTEKLRDRTNAAADAKAPAAPKKGGSLLERFGFVQQPVEKSVSDRFDREFNHRVPITLLVKYAMDAVDDGRIKLAPVADVKREFIALVDAGLAEKIGADPKGDVEVREYVVSPRNLMTGTYDDGRPLPPEIMTVVREILRKMGAPFPTTAPIPFPFSDAGKDPLDTAKEATEGEAPDAPPNNVFRITNDPFETSHEG